MWMVDTRIMCQRHLLGEHRELHGLAGMIRLDMKTWLNGYVRYGLVELNSIEARHQELVEEMEKRGWKHQSPIGKADIAGDRVVDRHTSLTELLSRCEECSKRYALRGRS